MSRHPRMLRPALPSRRTRKIWEPLLLAVIPASVVLALVLGFAALGVGGAP